MRPLAPLLSVLAFCSVSLGQTFPDRPAGPVADFANVISQTAQQKITLIAQALWEQAGFGLVVATIPKIENSTIDEYAPELYKRWGIGKKGSDEGTLVLLSLDPRKARVEVGYGSEGYLNDAKTGRILDEYGVPYFRNSDFSTGLVNVSLAIAGEVAHEKNLVLTLPRESGFAPARSGGVRVSPLHLVLFVIVAIFLLGTPFGRAILWAMLLSGLMGGGQRRIGGGFGGGFGGGGFGGGFGGGSSGGGGASRGF